MSNGWLRYTNQGAIRNDPLSQRLVNTMSFLPELGISMEVFSGGQENNTTHGTGSTRHNDGDAADVFFYKDGRKLDWANPQDVPIYQDIVRRAKAAGLTGFGAGTNYMQPGSMHIGYGNPAVWGANGAGVNAPNWLRAAYGAAPSNTVSRASTGAQPMAQPAAQPQQRGIRGFLADPDKRDRLIMALEGMTLNPNQALIQTAAQGIQGRAAERKAGASRSRTAEWLKSQGREDLAQAVVAGAIPAQAAVASALSPAADDKTAKQKNYEFFKSLGMSHEEALSAIKAGTTVNVGNEGPEILSGGRTVIEDPSTESGYRIVNITGGEADLAAQEGAKRETTLEETQSVRESVVSGSVSDALAILKKTSALDLPESGVIGDRLAKMGLNQEAVDLKNILSTIHSTVAVDTLQKMREASKTGGALGAVSERELALLMNNLGAIQQDTSGDLLARNLQEIDRIMGKIQNDPVASQFYETGQMPQVNSGSVTQIPSAAPTYLNQQDTELWDHFTDEEKRAILDSYGSK